MQSTTNYNLNKPENTDEIKISDLNENFDKIDTELKNANNEIDGLNENKVSTTGDVSDTIVTEYTTTQTSFPTLSVGEKLKVVFGKINKFISDVKNWKTTVDENLETNTTAIETLNSDLENLEHQQSETKIQVSGSLDSDPVQGIKDAWPTLPDGLYLLYLTRGTVYCAIVLRVNNGDYGSAYIMSYALDSPIYLTKNQNDYVQH